MRCEKCAYRSEDAFKFCPECGAPATSQADADENRPVSTSDLPDHDPAEQQRLQSERIAYVRHDYDPGRDGRFQASPHVPPSAIATPSLETGTAAPPYAAAAPAMQRKSTTGSIVLSIVNMRCCGFCISSILGMIALIFAIMSSSETLDSEAETMIRWARNLNIIGLAFIVLQLLVLILIFVGSLLVYRGAPSFNPGSFPRDFPLG